MSLRQKAVDHMEQHKADYEGFLGENVDEYLKEMHEDGTWGDELTLVRSLMITNNYLLNILKYIE